MPISEEHRRLLAANNADAKAEARHCIKTALVSLLKTERYENIRMTDIIRRSGVSRMGVYNNYKSKAEIMLEIYREPLKEIFANMGSSIYDNLDLIIQTTARHRDDILALVDAGLAYTFLDMMNARFEDASKSFYIPLWNGLLYNAMIEWVKTGADEPAEIAAQRLRESLHLLAKSIESGETNATQNLRLDQAPPPERQAVDM